MEYICPLCNGLYSIAVPCKQCGVLMENMGQVSDFYGPYSPYEEQGALQAKLGEDPNVCTHLFYCIHCDIDTRVQIDKIKS